MSFNPRSPQGGATKVQRPPRRGRAVSIHAPRKGERQISPSSCIFYCGFNPRSPQGGATRGNRGKKEYAGVSIHAPRKGERRIPELDALAADNVSIHAPRKGERQRKSAFVCSISANLLNIIHCGTVTRTVSRRRIALFRLFSVRRSGVFMYAYASH